MRTRNSVFLVFCLFGVMARLAAMDHASSMNKVRWEDLLSDSDDDTPVTPKDVQFRYIGLDKLGQKKVLTCEDSPASSFEEDYLQDAVNNRLRVHNVGVPDRTLAKRGTLTVCTHGQDELQIMDDTALVYDSAIHGATHAAISPTRKLVTVACRDNENQLLFLTIGVPQDEQVASCSMQEIFNEPLEVTVDGDQVVVSAITKLSYLSDHEVQVEVAACSPKLCDCGDSGQEFEEFSEQQEGCL